MRTFLFRIWQWTWGFPQTFVGFLIFLLHKSAAHRTYHGCIATKWKQSGSMSLGMFLFLSEKSFEGNPQVQVHEFGHAVQSAILGPLYLPVMGLPSFLWCNLEPFRKLRREKDISYYRLYTESNANWLGTLVAKEPCDLQ